MDSGCIMFGEAALRARARLGTFIAPKPMVPKRIEILVVMWV
jgi:hypothetical protein